MIVKEKSLLLKGQPLQTKQNMPAYKEFNPQEFSSIRAKEVNHSEWKKDIKHMEEKAKGSLKLLSWNLRSLNEKQKLDFITSLDVNIVAIQETFLKPHIEMTTLIKDDEETIVRFDGEGGGTMLMLDKA